MAATIEREFLELMHQTITVEKLIGCNPNGGDPIYGPPQKYRARVVDHQQLVVDADGQERMARTIAWIYGYPDVTTDDRVTLPDGRQPFIINVFGYPDEKGNHHVKLAFG